MTIFTSQHRSNKHTSIEVTFNYLILRDENFTEVLPLTDIDITNLEDLLELSIHDGTMDLGKLKAAYDNRGEPYVSGVTLTVGDTDVFLDRRDISDFIEAVKEYR